MAILETPSDIRDQLCLFIARAEQLRECKLVQSTFPVSLSLKYNRLKGMQVSLTQPNEENFRSFLLVLRPFISPREPVYLFRIYNLCLRHFTNDRFKHLLEDAREKWKAQLKSDGISFIINNQEQTPEQITDLWLNAEYFHNDDAKRKFLAALDAPGLFLSREKFLYHCLQATRQVLYVYSMAKAALREGLVL